MEAIIVAVVSGSITLLGTILTILSTQKKTDSDLKARQDVISTKLEELTREVREHNNFAKRMPVVEEQIKVINHRIADLESKGENKK